MRLRPLARAGIIAGTALTATAGFAGLAQAHTATMPATTSMGTVRMAGTISAQSFRGMPAAATAAWTAADPCRCPADDCCPGCCTDPACPCCCPDGTMAPAREHPTSHRAGTDYCCPAAGEHAASNTHGADA
jgi:hypothetical protein